MSRQREIAEAVVRQYARGLSKLNLDLIVPILHPQFRFVYRIAMHEVVIIAPTERMFDLQEAHGRGYGVKSNIRYIGHLYLTFFEMRKKGITSISTDFFYFEIDGEQILCIRLLPPHDRRIVFPMDTDIREEMRAELPAGEAFLLPRVKHGMLCKVECYPSMRSFNYHVDGTFKRNAEKE